MDRDPYTRWACHHWRNGEWLAVDLGARRTIRRELNWEHAYAKGYRVLVSDDGTAWRPVWTTINSDGGHDSVRFAATRARHVRIVGVTRGTRYGISRCSTSRSTAAEPGTAVARGVTSATSPPGPGRHLR